MHQLQMNLQRGIAQQAGELGLRGDLRGHQVQQHNFQRPDILLHGPMLGHDKYILLVQRTGGRQVVGNLNGQGISLLN